MLLLSHRLIVGFTFLTVLRPTELETNVTTATGDAMDHAGYPPSIFTMDQMESGAVTFYFIGMMYMFLALAVVCDEFFVPALEVLAEKLNLSADVAGATFMAAGGSAPELFTNVAGLFIISSPVGIGTVVGSAVFNILFVIGACSLASKELLCLTWWPLFRDGVFYSVSLLVLIVSFRDGLVTWIESTALVVCYVAYAVFMKYNHVAEIKVKYMLLKLKNKSESPVMSASRLPRKSIMLPHSQVKHLQSHPSDIVIDKAVPRKSDVLNKDNNWNANGNKENGYEHKTNGGTNVETGRERRSVGFAEPRNRRSTGAYSQSGRESLQREESGTSQHIDEGDDVSIGDSEVSEGGSDQSHDVDSERSSSDESSDPLPMEFIYPQNDSDDDDNESVNGPVDLTWPSSTWARIKYIVMIPIIIPLWLTLADVRKPGSERWAVLTFMGSIIWIGGYSYLMVWWAVVAGKVFKISDTIMGMTFLAAGTSVPDLLTSVIVARKGKGDMAVSSSVGSNLFDITIGLPVPWLIYIATTQKGYAVDNKGMMCSIVLLFLMLIMVVLSIAGCGWKMHKGLGIVMLILYILFLSVAIMLENKVLSCPAV